MMMREMQPPSSQLRLVPIVLATVSLAIVFGFVEGESVDARGVTALVAVLWWVSPLVVYYAAVRTRIGAIAIGAAYLVAVAFSVVVLYRQESSTAAVGFFAIPLMLWLGVILGLLLERASVRTFRTP
jgi:hypothetical protein